MDNPENKPILDMPLLQVMRPEIASTLGQVMQIYTVGHFLTAWKNPRRKKKIEQMFDTPQQARQAIATCTAWLGHPQFAHPQLPSAWWTSESRSNTDLQ